MRSSLNRPRLSQALRRPAEKHSERKAKTSKMVDLPLPLAEEDGKRGNAFKSRSCRARKFFTCRDSIRGDEWSGAKLDRHDQYTKIQTLTYR